jgi:hypothetical protein
VVFTQQRIGIQNITIFVVQRPSWETNSRLADQEFALLLWNPKVQYCVQPQKIREYVDQLSSCHSHDRLSSTAGSSSNFACKLL